MKAFQNAPFSLLERSGTQDFGGLYLQQLAAAEIRCKSALNTLTK